MSQHDEVESWDGRPALLGARTDRAESVNHPKHYGGDDVYEHIKVVEAWGLGYALGNCTKYICRAGRKASADHLEDLKKAQWYLAHEIARIEKERA